VIVDFRPNFLRHCIFILYCILLLYVLPFGMINDNEDGDDDSNNKHFV